MKKSIKNFYSSIFLFFCLLISGCPVIDTEVIDLEKDKNTGDSSTTEETPVNPDDKKILSSIFIKSLPKKIEFNQNSTLDLTGLVVFGIFEGKSDSGTWDTWQEEIKDWTSYPENNSILTRLGTQPVTIYYKEKSVQFDINVKEYKPTVISDSYFWGTWVRMDKGTEYEILESNVLYYGSKYKITASSSESLTVSGLGEFRKQSDSVMLCGNIPYFRKGGANLEYSLRIVGFAPSSRATATETSEMKDVRARSKSNVYPSYDGGERVSDEHGLITFNAPTVNDTQTVEIQTDDNEIVVVPGLKINNNGDFMGTVALVDRDQYNLKITGTISENQKDDGYLYGNNAKEYELVITITNISDNVCSSSVCTIEAGDPSLSLKTSKGYSSFGISKMLAGATCEETCYISYGEIKDAYVDTGINIKIENSDTGQVWMDYIPLRFFRGLIPITIAAKNPEDNKQAALNGFIIYPDGNNQFFSVRNNASEILLVPTFGSNEKYKMVFSGATVSSELSNSTEMYYTVVPASSAKKEVITLSDDPYELLGYMRFGNSENIKNDSEETAFDVQEPFEAYLSEGEIDYYTITADGDEFYAPGAKSFCNINYETGYEDVPAPASYYCPEGTRLSLDNLPILQKQGMTFLGWKNGYYTVSEGFTVASDMTLTAEWELTSYSITYETNGGTNASLAQEDYTISDTIVLKEPSRAGYEFGGWYLDSTLGGERQTSIQKGSTGNITFYAKWKPIVYTIEYVLNCEDDVENPADNPSSYTADDAIELNTPSRDGYDFDGWYKYEYNIGSGIYDYIKITSIEQGSLGDITLYAEWNAKSYAIEYVIDGNNYETSYYTKGTDVYTLSVPSRTGYEFKGWYTNPDFEAETLTEIGTSTPKDIILYGSWNLSEYTITYNLNCAEEDITGLETNPVSYTIESDNLILSIPTRNGYEFGGWYTTEIFEEGSRINTIYHGSSGEITLYAKWFRWFTINYSSTYGELPQSVTVQEGTNLSSENLYELTESGWKFNGWFLDSDYTQRATTEYVINGSITLYAKWSLPCSWEAYNPGSYRFVKSGSSWTSNNNGVHGSTATTTWDLYVGASIRYTIGYSVSSESGCDKLNIYLDGERIVSDASGSCNSNYTTILLEGTHTIRATYSKDGSVNSGSDQATIVLEDVDYETQGYEVFNIDYSTEHGIQPQSVSLVRGSSLTSSYLPELSENGYLFKGWICNEETVSEGFVVTGNMVLTADWEIISYRITYDTNGGKKNAQNPSSYTVEDEIELKNPTYAGKTFAGWFLDASYTQRITRISRGTIGDFIVYARWGEAGGITVSLKEYNDITVTHTRNGNYITFTGPENFTNYEWQIDNSKVQSANNHITINVSDWNSGKHTIMLFVSDGNSNAKRSATMYVDIE